MVSTGGHRLILVGPMKIKLILAIFLSSFNIFAHGEEQGERKSYKTYGMTIMGYKKDVVKDAAGQFLVQYPKKRKLKDYRVRIRQGIFYYCSRSGMRVHAEDYMFIMNKRGHFYIGKKVRMKFHHSSLNQGRPVASAGLLSIYDGVLQYIKPHSGHYMTTNKMFRHALTVLKSRGVDLSQALPPSAYFRTFVGDIFIRLNRFGIKRFTCDRSLYPSDC